MNEVKRNNIIEFYNSEIKLDGMPGSEELTDVQIQELSESYIFAGWMIATKYKECADHIKEIVNNILFDNQH